MHLNALLYLQLCSCGATMMGWLEICFNGAATPDDETFLPEFLCGVQHNNYCS